MTLPQDPVDEHTLVGFPQVPEGQDAVAVEPEEVFGQESPWLVPALQYEGSQGLQIGPQVPQPVHSRDGEP